MRLAELADRLREELSNYRLAEVRDALGAMASAAVEREQRTPGLVQARNRADRLALLIRLFLLGDHLSENEYRAALPSLPLDEAMRYGLMRDDMASAIAIRPVAIPARHGGGELLIASDLGPLQGRAPSHDHVMPVGGATKTLAAMTRYEPGQTVLDLGTGCGFHALLAARAGAQVVATDVSERALEFTRLNARLAGVDVETRLGSLFDPVAERFDRIVSNPPFVVTPPAVREMIGTYDYRDAGESFLERIVTGVGDHLTDSGTAWMLGNWVIDAEADSGELAERWPEPLVEWLGGREAWVVLRDAIDPAQYAEMWLQDAGISGAEFMAAYGAWLEAAAGSIGFGYITVGAGHGPQRFEDYRGPIGETFADAAWDNRHLARLDDEELLDQHLVANRIIEKRLHTPGQGDPWLISLLAHGREMTVSAEVAGLVGACDGDLSVAQIVGALSSLLDVPALEMADAVMPSVNELIGAGMLTVRE